MYREFLKILHLIHMHFCFFIVIYLYHHLPGILSFLCYDRHLKKNCLIPHFINHPHHLHQSYYYSNIFPLNLPDVVLLTFTSIKCVGVVVCCGTCQLKEEKFYILDLFLWWIWHLSELIGNLANFVGSVDGENN